mgnify:CR=1 FL=1
MFECYVILYITKFADNRKKYTASKNEFIPNVLGRAYKMYNLDQLPRFKT